MSPTATDPTEAPTTPDPTEAGVPSTTSKWLWRIGSLLIVGVAVLVLVLGSSRAEVNRSSDTGDPVVNKLTPGQDAKALRQTQIGADLQEGFDGRLTVNGVEVPEAQMDGVVDPASPEAARLAPDQANQLRPNNRNRVFFSPGPGKVVEKLPQGDNEITVTYFRDGAPTLQRGSLTWTINVD